MLTSARRWATWAEIVAFACTRIIVAPFALGSLLLAYTNAHAQWVQRAAYIAVICSILTLTFFA